MRPKRGTRLIGLYKGLVGGSGAAEIAASPFRVGNLGQKKATSKKRNSDIDLIYIISTQEQNRPGERKGNMSSSSADVLKISILGNESIHVGFHLLPYIFKTITTTLPSSTYVLITDTNLSAIYLNDFKASFEEAASEADNKARFLVYEVAPGEGAKSRKVKGEIEDWMLDNKCTRDTVILAFGGGVIGDLTGFVAATLWVPCFGW